MDPAHPDRLASDLERNETLSRLRTGCAEGRLTMEEFADRAALVYGARTAGELERVVADLPTEPDPQPAPRTKLTHRVVSVFGGARQGGRWRPARPTKAIAVLGGCQLDLCDAELDGGDVEIRAIAVLGGIEIVVPEGVAAELGGTAILGSRDFRVSHRDPRPGEVVVRVRATAILGGVTVRTRRFTGGRHRGDAGRR